jgi:hypothetical protein
MPPPASATGALAASVGTQRADDGPVTFTDDEEQLPQNSRSALPETSDSLRMLDGFRDISRKNAECRRPKNVFRWVRVSSLMSLRARA